MKVDLAYAERQLRHWSKKVEELRLTSNASNAKEKDKGKEKNPPDPLKEKRETEKENNNHNNRVRVRARGVCSQPPTVEEVAAFVKEIGCDVDPEYFWRYYNSNHRRWPHEWRDRLRNWIVNGNPRGRISPDETSTNSTTQAGAKKRLDWTLCAERCANCDGTRCLRGVTIPPADDNPPRPPEECPLFQPTNSQLSTPNSQLSTHKS